ncbi:hypothetical protein Sfum_0499 [Syntrophobacter fumaroxidans MPOB]|uniref:Uncharacterized protein n=1 Tax=Syntrophobacter fumaroxidans (strain DSM 10017 / MPOB) TaxID=335543 RepID=A0LFJ7_SYNFM|nr:hypothetical protein Sfum_0499 [Syntrophobacter fumaroxidans MPOB]
MPTIVQPGIPAPGRNRSVAMARFWAHLKRHNPAMRIKSRQNPALSGHKVWRDSREDANRLGKSKDRAHAKSSLTQRRDDGRRSAHTFAKRKGAGDSGACPLPFRTCMKTPDKGVTPTSGLQLEIDPA